jgi:acetyltransferase-like isoleucine patch superfamily enzyme
MNFTAFLKHIYVKYRIYTATAYSLPHIYSKYYGVRFGKNVRITGKKVSFGGEPFLVEIGDNVTITPGVKFQTHDGGVALFRNQYPGINVFGRIKVGNDVFIGEDAMIMYGITIGDNVVIGARSVVTKDIPSDCVVAGVPAKIIKPLAEYKENSLKKATYVFSADPIQRKNEILSQINK